METFYIKTPIDEPFTLEMEPCVMALGFFDGVHIGHQRILETAKQIAKKKQCIFGVMTFFPHPKDILFSNREPMTYLTPLSIKEERFEELGVEKLFVIEFNPDFARLSPEEFVEQYIIGFHCVHVVAGFDYHYGSRGAGNMRTLSEHSPDNLEVTTVCKVDHYDEKISSTAIRKLLEKGLVGMVPMFLGDFYEVQGIVNQNTLFYKNNQFLKLFVDRGYRMPKSGIYRIHVELNDIIYEGTCHQISFSEQHNSLLIQLTDCFVDTFKQRVKVRWVDYICGKQNEAYGVYDYMHIEDLVI